MNNVDIFRELEDLRYRKGISIREISMICDVKPQSAGDWFKRKKVDDKYLWLISDKVGDDRFLLALLCYELRLPNNYLNSLIKSKDDSLSTLIGVQKEDRESDIAIPELMEQLSSLKPDTHSVGKSALEVLDTGLKMIVAFRKIINSEDISVDQAILERR